MGLLRSETVDLYEVLIPKDSDWDIMNMLGHLNCLHFIDLNKNEQPHHLKYTAYVKRAEESERKIHEVEEFCHRYKVDMKSPVDIDTFLEQVNQIRAQKGKAVSLLFNDIEHDLDEKVVFLRRQSERIEQMVKIYKNLISKVNVLSYATDMLKLTTDERILRSQDQEIINSQQEPLLSSGEMRISYIGGTILKEDQMRFKKFLFRATRGKAYTTFYEMKVPREDRLRGVYEYDNKLVYFVLFEEGAFLRERIHKICSSFLDTVFDIEKNTIMNDLLQSKRQKEDTKMLLKQTKHQLKQYLMDINTMIDSDYSLIQIYKWFIIKEKAIYKSLNMLKYGDKILIGLMWCPIKLKPQLDNQLNIVRMERKINVPQIRLLQDQHQNMIKPTFIDTNEFTWPFQEIVNTYGIPMYKEANPALFSIITFPFMFGIMFGDMLHGTMLFIFATMVCFSDRKPGTIWGDFSSARYLLMLMGLYSAYAGLMYNDMTSIPLKLFGDSCYIPNPLNPKEAVLKNDCIYPAGIDPIWYMSKNELSFSNSLKMKLSVILGVAQMAVGVIFKGLNCIHSNNKLDFIFEFIPQIILLFALFGFMDLMIIIKWLTNYSEMEGTKPPAIISQMIIMCLNFGVPPEGNVVETPLIPNQIFWMQFLLIVAIICVPIMLFVKPIYLSRQNNKEHTEVKVQLDELQEERRHYEALIDNKINSSSAPSALESYLHESSEKKESTSSHDSFGELFIHQMIETIEFVLGTVSNTASYLRLWALSLAHSQLSTVFFDNTIKVGLQAGSFIQLFLGFFVFMFFTIGVLMFMDLLEAFLHCLRLHWVEFQNKFYKGTGYKFTPFSIETILKNEQVKDQTKASTKKQAKQ